MRALFTRSRLLLLPLLLACLTLPACASMITQGPAAGSTVTLDPQRAAVHATARATTRSGYGCAIDVAGTAAPGTRRPSDAVLRCDGVRLPLLVPR